MAIKSRKYKKNTRMRRYKTMKGGSGSASGSASGSSRLSGIRTALKKASKIFSRGPNIQKFAKDMADSRNKLRLHVKQNTAAKVAKKTHLLKEQYIIPHYYYFYLTRVIPNYITLYLLSDSDAFVEVSSNGSDGQPYPIDIVTPELIKIKELYDSQDTSTQAIRKQFIFENFDLFNDLVGGENYRLLQTNKEIISDEKRQSCIIECKKHILGHPSSTKTLDTHFKKLVIKRGENISEKLKEYLDSELKKAVSEAEAKALKKRT